VPAPPRALSALIATMSASNACPSPTKTIDVPSLFTWKRAPVVPNSCARLVALLYKPSLYVPGAL
jgi:hypothetical protein